jgi:tRNA dimethylallyltransferase
MIENGFIEEARQLYPLRHLNALNTVGYKELFLHFDGVYTLPEAVEKIKRNTRIYARKQITWYKRSPEIHWFHPDTPAAIINYTTEVMSTLL